MDNENGWLRKIAEDPGHSAWYIRRFRDLAERGEDLAGEARLIDAMAPRSARILDAGCGTGRVGAVLAAAGHDVTGVDLDPELIAAARADHPGPVWQVGDLSELDLPAAGLPGAFDLIVCAGNVMAFAAPASRVRILRRFRAHLGEGGRAVVGFGAGRGYDFDRFLDDVPAAGLAVDLLLGTWDLRPYRPGSNFLVAVLSAA